MNLRHSIAPRVLDNSLPTATLVSTAHFSVRVTPPAPPIRLSSNPPILTTFVWRDAGAKVSLAGSFDDWRKHPMTFIPDIRYHVLVTELPPGDYVYRFVVDGRWRVADGDPNLVEDQFGEFSHFLSISNETLQAATPKHFSTAVVAHAEDAVADKAHVVMAQGESDTESEGDDTQPSSPAHHASSPVEDAPLPRKRGDANYIEDYDDDACGELDLQADVFEAIKDVAETTDLRDHPTSSTSQVSNTQKRQRGFFRRPAKNCLRRVWGVLFGDVREENVDPAEETSDVPTRNQKKLGLAENENALKKGLKVWFPNERNFPGKEVKGRKVDETETKEVIEVGDKALKLHQVEDNANTRQMLGKTLFAQGKYDAALALFSLSVKLREDNGLKFAKTTAIAHTDVASAFIHIDDLKNAEKHLKKALAIYAKGTFSGGRAQLGDVHCFLGVIGDMKGDLKSGELAYRNALDLYEKSKATEDNPNYATAIENLNANLRRQRLKPAQADTPVQHQRDQTPEDIGSTSSRQEENQPPKVVESPPLVRKQAPPLRPPPAPPAPQRPMRPLEPSRPEPQVNQEERRTPPRGILRPANQAVNVKADMLNHAQSKQSFVEMEANKRKSREVKSWKDLADNARNSMPQNPPVEDLNSEDEEQSVGAYEEMSRTWHKDGRKLLAQGKYKEAIDLYTLAVYTRKRHGPWATRENAETLVECARALFAMKDLKESVNHLRDAIAILEQLNVTQHGVFLGEVWSNLGSVIDRLGGHGAEALAAHSAAMVAYGRAGMSKDNAKWLKAWKSLCMNLKLNGESGHGKSTDEVWKIIDQQIRGVIPTTTIGKMMLRV